MQCCCFRAIICIVVGLLGEKIKNKKLCRCVPELLSSCTLTYKSFSFLLQNNIQGGTSFHFISRYFSLYLNWQNEQFRLTETGKNRRKHILNFPANTTQLFTAVVASNKWWFSANVTPTFNVQVLELYNYNSNDFKSS